MIKIEFEIEESLITFENISTFENRIEKELNFFGLKKINKNENIYILKGSYDFLGIIKWFVDYFSEWSINEKYNDKKILKRLSAEYVSDDERINNDD